MGTSHRASILALCILGCSTRLSGGEGEGEGTTGTGEADTSTDETTASTGDTTDTSDLACDPQQCMQYCARDLSECLGPLVGECIDEHTCECMPLSPCPPCLDESCAWFEHCTSEFGYCTLDCSKTVPFAELEDPPGSCTLPLLESDYPPVILPYSGLELDGVELFYVDDCSEEAGVGGLAWTRTEDEGSIVLCEQACLALADGAAIDYVVGCPPK